METRTRLSVASAATPPTLPDLNQHAHQHAKDIMGIEFSEQLLTPENSRSETSSNNENASNEEKPAVRRTSTRVTRASLRGAAQLDNLALESNNEVTISTGEENRTVPGEISVNKVSEGKKSQYSLPRHSIAVMEKTMWREAALSQDHTEAEDHPQAPDTPVSKSSQEPQPSESGSSLPQRTLRKRVQQPSTNEENQDQDQDQEKAKTTPEANSQEPPRRSSRLSILGKASDLVDRASSLLGKRSRDMIDKGKEIGRRASLRPRNVVTPKEESTSAANEPPAAKKRRVSDSELLSKSKSREDSKIEEDAPPKPVLEHKRKRWLAHGLYTGQEHTDARPSQNRNRNTKRRSESKPQRRLLPMPMFAGDRLLKSGRDFQLPYDIFSPLPPGQPKPDEWRKTNKNVFVGEASSIWRANKHEELSKCLCTEDTGCDEECQNRYMFYECDNGNCALGPECGNRNFDELKQRTKAGGKYNIGVEVIKTSDRGYGVRSNRTFEPNQIIVEYTGEIVTQNECERRMRSVYKNNECYYLMYFDQNMIIDATRGSIARFVNHSCEPNCRMEKWTVAGKPRMALFAGDRGIMTGEELTYDYNFDPYSQKNVQQCRCGSSVCRGILGPRPRDKDQRASARESKGDNQKKSNSNTKKANAKATGSKRKLENAIDESAARINKKRKLLTPKSIKSGVKKAVSRARPSASKSTTTQKKQPATKQKRKATKEPAEQSTKAKSPAKKNTKFKDNVKLPKVKAKAKVKATVRPTKATGLGKAQSKPTTSQSPSKLNRPSAETKAKILAAAKGTPARKRLTKEKKTEAKPASKPTPKEAPKNAAKSAVRSVKGKKN
ncbi:hypothetical protein MW887_002823 [Aspergillus wentii]|nr:hypothetical protein MW887_002823 [Aspergillus wentii]